MTPEEFEEIVKQTVNDLPAEFAKALENVAVLVEPWPTEEDYLNANIHPRSLLLGLYRGIPKTQKSRYHTGLPDKIVIFAIPILIVSQTVEEAKAQIRKTVLHEIGHYFGLNEHQIREAQKKN